MVRVSSLAHPIRLGKYSPEKLEELIGEMRDAGLQAIEAYHTDHSARDTEQYLDLARRFDMPVTGGSDFHGDVKPNVRLGRLDVPRSVLDNLRER